MAQRALLMMSVILFSACAHSDRLAPAGGFRHEFSREHPLSGRIWSTREARFVEPQLLFSNVRASRFLLLGESHDNRDHHLLEARLLDVFLSAHPAASVGFEMLDESQAPALAPPLPNSAEELARRVHWAESGWPDFALYEPVFSLLLAQHARVFAAHPSREHVHEAMRGSTPELRAQLKLDDALPAELHDALAAQIRESHCGYAPEEMVEPMVQAQVFKDAFMAHALLAAQAPAALVAGGGHVDGQRGVPRALRRQGASDVLSIAFLEVDDARTQPADYDAAAYDFVLFTPRTTNESACERFRRQLEHMRDHGHSGG